MSRDDEPAGGGKPRLAEVKTLRPRDDLNRDEMLELLDEMRGRIVRGELVAFGFVGAGPASFSSAFHAPMLADAALLNLGADELKKRLLDSCKER